MQYMILIYEDEKRWATIPEAEAGKIFNDYMEYSKALAQAGALKSGAGLTPTRTATTLREVGGKITTTDGPFAETKEQLGGNYLIDVPSLDEALKWAAKCPGIHGGTIEVRPIGVTSDGVQ